MSRQLNRIPPVAGLTCQSPLVRSVVMLAEIYMLRLEAAARAAKEAATSSSQFVPISLPVKAK